MLRRQAIRAPVSYTHLVCVTFDRDSLPEGDYLIGFLWEDTCSRQKLYRFSPEMLLSLIHI